MKEKRHILNERFHNQPIFSDKVVVEMFLEAVNRWFISSNNQLYGRRDECRTLLLNYLETGLSEQNDSSLIYVLDKFKREWCGDHACVFWSDL